MNRKWLCILAFAVAMMGSVGGASAIAADTHKKSAKTSAYKSASTSKSTKNKVSKRKKAAAKKLRSGKIKAHSRSSKARTKVASRVVSEPDFIDGLPNLRSGSALVVDQKTGEALYAKNSQLETPIASITKLMTAMVTLDAGLAMSEEITVDGDDIDHLKGTGSRVAVGSTLTREELLHMALIASENRAAAALSRAYPGGRSAFIDAMNRKARVLGMHNTHFVDGTGLNSQNRSTAEDLARLVNSAYQYPEIRNITTTGSYDVWVPGARNVRHIAFNNTNALTRNGDWEIGVSKTGFINEAGHCLVMQAKIAERKVIIVLLDSWGKWSRIGDANRIRKWLESHGGSERFAGGASSSAV